MSNNVKEALEYIAIRARDKILSQNGFTCNALTGEPVKQLQEGIEWAINQALTRAESPQVDWQPANVEEPKNIHNCLDALSWAEFFCEVYPQHKHMEDVIHGWFANAMMAMHDNLAQPPAPIEGLGDALSG